MSFFAALASGRQQRLRWSMVIPLLLLLAVTAAIAWRTTLPAAPPPSRILSGALGDDDDIDNPTRHSANATRMWIASSLMERPSKSDPSAPPDIPIKFELPTDLEWIKSYRGIAGPNNNHPQYLRPISDITQRRDSDGNNNPCTGAMEVFRHISKKVHSMDHDAGILIIAGGDLIHLHREGDFVNSTTQQFYDDDIDAWTSLETLAKVAEMEPYLFETYGWTVRLIVTRREEVRPFGYPLLRASYWTGREYAVLAQAFAVCGHDVETERSMKVTSTEPTIDLYPVVTILEEEEEEEGDTPDGAVARLRRFLSRTTTTTKSPKREVEQKSRRTRRTVKDLWQGNQYEESLLFPPRRSTFVTAGLADSRENPLPLMLPAKPMEVLECVWGNWTVPSSAHAGSSLVCTDDE